MKYLFSIIVLLLAFTFSSAETKKEIKANCICHNCKCVICDCGWYKITGTKWWYYWKCDKITWFYSTEQDYYFPAKK